jgi:sugar-specific transcriptional regulator TrmB
MKLSTFAAKDLNSIETQLEEFGMKKTLARLYVALVANGQSSAFELSKTAGIHRVDIYKRLQEMVSLGLCNLKLGRPRKYAATDPNIVVDLLLKNKITTIRQLLKRKSNLIQLLQGLWESSNPKILTPENDLLYELIIGRRQIYDATRRILRLANHEVLRVISPNGIKRSYKYKLLGEYVDCVKRGVKVRIITDITNLPKRLINYCASNFELRHSKESLMKLLIVDRRLVMLSGVPDDSNFSLDSSATRMLVSNDENLLEMLSIIFRHIWDSAKIVRD